MSDEDQKLSAIGLQLQRAFNLFKERDYQTLFVCANLWGDLPFMYVAAPKGVWPWAVFDDDTLVHYSGIEKPLIAFDLKGEFEKQFPQHLHQIDKIDCLHMTPLINIPDRTGHIPAKKQQEFREKALQSKRPAHPSHLRLVKR